MSYIESFKAVMDEVRILMADCDMPFLDKLQAAHDAEMKQLSKEEFHRGYESGVEARDVSKWKLDRMRNAAIQNLQAVEPSELCGSHEILSAICKAIFEPPMGWTIGAGEILRDHLVYLLGGKSINKGAETSSKVVKNGEKYQLATYDVLGNERHKAVCELRKLRERDVKIWNIEISIALGLDLDASNDDVCDQLIHLLGGDDETASNDDRTCPIAVQSPSITDELRTWVRDHIWQHADNHTELIAIADRIDAQFERICSQHEAVLQQTIGDTVDEHEREMAELRASKALADPAGVFVRFEEI